MTIPASLKSHGTLIGWIVFIVLLLPVLVFLIVVASAEGFNPARLAVAAVEVAVVALAAWLLGRGLSSGSRAVIAAAVLIIALILVAYGAAAAVIIGGLNFKIF